MWDKYHTLHKTFLSKQGYFFIPHMMRNRRYEHSPKDHNSLTIINIHTNNLQLSWSQRLGK